jgi:hypothetical protein
LNKGLRLSYEFNLSFTQIILQTQPELLFFSIVAAISIIFPPVRYGIFEDGFSFLFSIRNGDSIDYIKLFIELILILLLTIIFYLLKYNIKSFINKLIHRFKTNKKLIRFILKLVLISIIFLGVIIIIQKEPFPLTTIPEKYGYESGSSFNEHTQYTLKNYYLIFNEANALNINQYINFVIFEKIANDDNDIIKKFWLPYDLVPDVTPYLINRDTLQNDESNFDMERNSWDKIFAQESDNELERWELYRIYIPDNKTFNYRNGQEYYENYIMVKRKYINDEVKWDANVYVTIYKIYTFWKKYLLIPVIILLTFLYFFISIKKIKKYRKVSLLKI